MGARERGLGTQLPPHDSGSQFTHSSPSQPPSRTPKLVVLSPRFEFLLLTWPV